MNVIFKDTSILRSICDLLSPLIIEKDTCHKGQMGVMINDDRPTPNELCNGLLDLLFRPDGMHNVSRLLYACLCHKLHISRRF